MNQISYMKIIFITNDLGFFISIFHVSRHRCTYFKYVQTYIIRFTVSFYSFQTRQFSCRICPWPTREHSRGIPHNSRPQICTLVRTSSLGIFSRIYRICSIVYSNLLSIYTDPENILCPVNISMEISCNKIVHKINFSLL